MDDQAPKEGSHPPLKSIPKSKNEMCLLITHIPFCFYRKVTENLQNLLSLFNYLLVLLRF